MTNLHEILHVKKIIINNNKINKNKGVKFCPVILTKKKQIETNKKGSWCDITRCVVPSLPTPLPLPDDREQPQLVTLMLELVKIGIQKTEPRCIVSIW